MGNGLKTKYYLCLVHVIWTDRRMSKLVLNVKYLLLLSFLTAAKFYHLGHIQKWSFLVICTTFRSAFHVSWKNQNKHSTLNSSFDTLFKWHEPDIRQTIIHLGPCGQFHLQIVVSIWSRKENPKWPILEITRQ